MTGFLQLLVFMLAAVNPAGAAAAVGSPGSRLPRQVLALAWAGAVVALSLAAVLADQILNGLGVEPETFRIAAGVVLMVAGALSVWTGGTAHEGPWEGRGIALFPLALPVLVSPASLASVISYGADRSLAQVVGATAIALSAAGGMIALRAGRYAAAVDGTARVTGALLVAVGTGLIVQGVRAI